MVASSKKYDFIIIGGGFFGCCLALFLRSISKKILIVESQNFLLNRASKNNQARIHSGFHYPRSPLTSIKSLILHQNFVRDFRSAVVDNFDMIYCVAKHRSKITSSRFLKMYKEMGASIDIAPQHIYRMFNNSLIEGVYLCREMAFDYLKLRFDLIKKLDICTIDVSLGTNLVDISEKEDGVVVGLSDGRELDARYVFNVTYSNINRIIDFLKKPRVKLKHEMAEIILCEPPIEISGLGITIMDGPFFSIMPYPAENLYSLSHVRYTPHFSWTDENLIFKSDYDPNIQLSSNFRYMISDGSRYLPSLSKTKYIKSVFEVKTVLLKNENDDGRPIMMHRHSSSSRVFSILGGKIDNIYDLFYALKREDNEFSLLDDRFLFQN